MSYVDARRSAMNVRKRGVGQRVCERALVHARAAKLTEQVIQLNRIWLNAQSCGVWRVAIIVAMVSPSITEERYAAGLLL